MTILQIPSKPATLPVSVRVHSGPALMSRIGVLDEYALSQSRMPVSRRPGWLSILNEAMGQTPYAVEAVCEGRTVGFLCLAYVHTRLFGRYLVSLPYVNSGGVIATDRATEAALTDQAVALANELSVRYLELRNEGEQEHPSLSHRRTDKVHMRLDLPTTGAALWEQIPSKVRNQVRKGQKAGFTIHWGRLELLEDFYVVFSQNMRDLGTPTFGRGLFAAILREFGSAAELCVVRSAGRPIAGALLLNGKGVAEVPSASSLKEYNPTCANMLLYWNLLERAAEQHQEVFDFGRSNIDSATCRFKKQWGAQPFPADWQYYVRDGAPSDMRKDNPKYRRVIAVWKRLPVGLTRWLGPMIVRGIP